MGCSGVRSEDWAGSLTKRKYEFFLGTAVLCPEHVVKVGVVFSWWMRSFQRKTGVAVYVTQFMQAGTFPSRAREPLADGCLPRTRSGTALASWYHNPEGPGCRPGGLEDRSLVWPVGL